jgi:hypothetical protein
MKPIFSRHEHINGMAFLNWRMDKNSEIINLWNMGDGFLLAALELAQQCLLDNSSKRADIIIFPILANANHGIELYLKGILWTLNRIMGSNLKIEGNHNIKQIFDTTRSKISKYKGQLSVKSFDAECAELKSYLDELFDKIGATSKSDNMDFSRYPFSKSYAEHFYVAIKGNTEIDLENFIYRFDKIHKNLDAVASLLYDQELMQNA